MANIVKSIRAGFDRIHAQHPDASFGYETEATREAERRFDELVALYSEGKCSIGELKEAFLNWEKAFLMQFQERTLF